ncbi:MAG: pyrroline-5-carboxylate reductase [Anaerolineales bacterium]
MTLKDQLITFIGPGAMASAMASRLIEGGTQTPDKVLMSGPIVEQLEKLEERLGVSTTTNNLEAVKNAGVVVLSVKPQSIQEVMDELHGAIPKDALVLSIVAGARLDTLVKGLNHKAIVRSMPNTPAQVGEGITVWTATEDVTEEQKERARLILKSFGEEVYADHEDYLDMATALSGTGPAYVFLLMEAMVDAGVHLGFPRRISEQLVVQTFKGSVAFYEHSPVHLARLRNQVTSPGGTSAAALYYLEKAGVRTALSRAIWAAYERSVQLGKGKKHVQPEDD